VPHFSTATRRTFQPAFTQKGDRATLSAFYQPKRPNASDIMEGSKEEEEQFRAPLAAL
jgi:hypothetical protein